ncbi:ATP-binding cassette domain-containing protein [bacterium]|nr:ATP-binding cassette domain-containing protein [bacterium]
MMGQGKEDNARWSGLIFHGWIAPLIRLGQVRPLVLEDLQHTPPHDDRLEQTSPAFRAAFSGKILPALLASFRIRFVKIAFLLIFLTALGLLRPLILRELISRFGGQQGTQPGFLFSAFQTNISMALFAIASFFSLALVRSHFIRLCFKLTWSMPGLLRYEVYSRLLHLNPTDRARVTTGEFVNIATRDCDSASMLPFLLEPLLYPVTILAYCAMLVSFLGPWALLAVVALAAVVPLGRRLERRMSELAAQIREQSRLRLGLLSEILSGIRVIKFHAWEDRFEERILKIRNQEVSLMRKRARVAARHSALSALLPILTGATVVTLVSWLTGVPSTANVFASFSVIASLVAIFSEIPDLLQNVSELKVSLGRIRDFLVQQDSNAQHLRPESTEITLIDATFSRPRTTHQEDENKKDHVSRDSAIALKNISLKIPKGACVAVVGSVGSGKSTLMSALLGELILDSGEAHLPYPIAYAPQVAWNQNASVRDNITFQQPLNPQLFELVTNGSALTQDINRWAGGRDAEVGERGINLSGGQKQRLALARTAYAAIHDNVPTVFWDDPFSALDESVANHVFNHLLQTALAGKTRLFSTHRVDFASRADWVVVIDSGRIVEQGEPEKLRANGGHFARLVELHAATRGHAIHDHAAAVPEESAVIAQEPQNAGKLTIEEQVTLPIFNKIALRAYFNALAPALGFVGVACIFLIPRLADIGSNVWLGHWTSHPAEIAISKAVLVFAILTFVTVLAERARSVVLFDGGVRAGTTFFEKLLNGVLHAPMRFFDTSPQGRILNRFTSDTSAIDSSMPSSVGQFLTAFIGIFASLLPVLWSSPATVFIMIPAAILYTLLFKSVRRAQLRLNALSQIVRSPWMSLTAETLPGLSVVRSLRAEDRFLLRYRALINRHMSTGFYVIATNLWFAFRLEVLGVSLVGGFILLLAIQGHSASLTVSAVGLTFSLQMIGILGNVARSLRMLENSLVSVDRVVEYSNLEPEAESKEAEVPAHWPTQGAVRLENLTASYAEHLKPVLKTISLKIPGGKKVGIVGRTGSGKSSLFLAMTRIMPIQKNMIFVDEVDITTLPLKELRKAVAIIPQDPVLFSGTLRENLDPFALYSDDEVSTALKRAHLQLLCASAHDAAKFNIEENGRNLSVGERQLVCLARALLSQSRILLIDEATANVDVATDALIQQTLREEFSSCTQFIIAHRTNTLKDVDLLIQLEDGQLTKTSEKPAHLNEANP